MRLKVVMANGCFDVLHRGHVEHLLEAAELGDYLIVALTEDNYVNKGPNKPLNTWEDRAFVLEQLACVDSVIPTKNACDAIRRIHPTIFVKGIDYDGGNNFSENIHSACADVGAKIMYTTSPKRSFDDILKKIK